MLIISDQHLRRWWTAWWT